jgi:F-box protein 33
MRLLEEKQFNSIESLHIASVKEDPDSYGLLDLSIHPFCSFEKLHTLSLDYDYITSDLLSHLITVKGRVPLEALSMHVHGLEHGREKISNMMWDRVVQANPNLAVTLSLLHSIDGCANLSDILRPAMPLVHFRMLFCQGLNVSGINFMSRFMNTRLESVYIVDGLDHGTPMCYDFVADEDPFVMMAWKCPNLKHFSLIGECTSSTTNIANRQFGLIILLYSRMNVHRVIMV